MIPALIADRTMMFPTVSTYIPVAKMSMAIYTSTAIANAAAREMRAVFI